MKIDDLQQFQDLITETLTGYGRTVSPAMLTIWVRALQRYDWPDIRDAIERHITDPVDGRFPPMPAHIISKIQVRDGHPSPDEAWAMCPASEDDAAVWTDAISAAYFETASVLLERGESIAAARRAFLESYARHLADARAHGIAPRFWISAGRNPITTATKVQQAVEVGLITVQFAEPYISLPAPSNHHRHPRLVRDIQPIDLEHIHAN